jgi:hypothetical protein
MDIQSFRALFAAIAISGIVVIGCGSIDKSQIIGIWKPSNETSKFVILPFGDTLYLTEEPLIEIKADGTFRAEHLPSVFLPFPIDSARSISGLGTWSLITKASSRPSVELDFAQLNDHVDRCVVNIYISYGLMDLNFGPLRLFFYVDDPDSGRRYTFEKWPSVSP